MMMVTLRWLPLLVFGLLVLLAGGLGWIGGEKVSVSRYVPLIYFFNGSMWVSEASVSCLSGIAQVS